MPKKSAEIKPTENYINRIPPQNKEAEQSVLGSLLLDRDAVIKIADLITADDFYEDKHKVIYLAILALYDERSSIDILTVSNKLDEGHSLDKIGGMSYLTTLVNSVPSSAHIVHYANIIRRKGTLRRLISASTDIVGLGYQEDLDLESLLDQAEQKLFSVSQKYLKQNFIALSEILHETFDRIDELHREKGKLRGVPTGFTDLDNKLGGLQKSDLVILAARPSMGKTSLALDIVRQVAMNENKAVAIFSLEMSKDQLVDRLLAAEADVDLWKMRTGKLNDLGPDNDFERIGHALGRLSEAPIYIDDSGALNIMELRTKARRLQAEHDLDLIVVDYLQLMQGRSTENRVQEVSEISRSLKILAKELNVPVLALSQLSRAVEQRGGDKKPQLSDLRESGSIEQDADVVMFIYRDEMYSGKDSKKPHIAEILIRKHRNGPTGDVELFFDAEKTSFKNLAKSPPPIEEAMMEQIME
ncbi:MAG: replicative DNA helicase [Candidatus Doudnabacteria bacterium RIFCSPHIGHO2_02_FULL_42_25]|uniref:Replicative DNA helicase n=1 Tax=Candidatus Doudnabacteria bacterium RIFCSPHIGHO2_01_FULL_41_86 TaxID=1817821 RepID=A0A1F5N9B1_9BACT|nr:MAG: replicative DNA helicase [Candidatus Doudnabacteria bacterium RIFCSPHIGHO2_01_FULL_41_86]OGE74852.1 MAG: replicative DNA helicase [Candidatus Doudnabacteria bacterium RIFCSPHIGHO2_01_43_10]OGE85196.1 MAG: replicative DNA helicase [Candidatus Doudnabacteria bacterium RIFCSPHIGHO2_12_FULL_42_22]OGE86734.1 MAG: replicative DNA helicase [Candidatus Doudnabacteria bacterium RIFCSPHIGHO2_02_FULL_42_25]OGE92332.1 MAG: replicative DNA helicase [Candidatus Doudnabacteria bacterium RIFCSPLOWO2_01